MNAVPTAGERPSPRDVADLMRELRGVRHLANDDPRRQAWLARKVDLLDRIGAQE